MFHFFRQLPNEIRCRIYELATEPRFVHVETCRFHGPDNTCNAIRLDNEFNEQQTEDVNDEDEDSELDEVDELDKMLDDSLPSDITLHPSLAYFSHNWRHRITHSRQRLLTDFGFSCTAPPAGPPGPLSQAPDICRHWLSEPRNRAAAWDMLGRQRSGLRSRAPIPALLHTCTESRAALIRHGYALSFATRAGAPAITWFCPAKDVLYLGAVDDTLDESVLLDGGTWGVGRFLPEDLLKIHRLALSVVDYPLNYTLGAISCTLRLLPKVQELFVVELNLNHMARAAWRRNHRLYRDEIEIGYAAKRDTWHWVECDEAEVFGVGSPSRDFVSGLQVAGNGGHRLVEYMMTHNRDSSGYFAFMERQIEEHLTNERDRVTAFEGVAPWSVPSVKLAHIGSRRMIKELFKRRDRYWIGVENRSRRERDNKERRGKALSQKSMPPGALAHEILARGLPETDLPGMVTPPPRSRSVSLSSFAEEFEILRNWDLDLQLARLADGSESGDLPPEEMIVRLDGNAGF